MALSLDFAFEGFRIVRERPRLLLFWGFVTLVGNGLGVILLVALSGAPFDGMIRVLQTGGNVMQIPFLLQQAAPGLFVRAAAGIVVEAILTAAVCRAAFGEDDDSLGFLRFGPRELQLILVVLVTDGLCFAAAGACMAVAVLPAMATRSVDGIGGICLVLGIIAAAAVMAGLKVRLMFNPVLSFVERRIVLFGSFALTREAFRTLFGGWLLAAVLAFVVLFLGEEVVAAVTGVLFGAAQPGRPDLTSLRAFLAPDTAVAFGLMYAFVSPQLMAVSLAAPVAAWRAVSGRDARAEAEKAA